MMVSGAELEVSVIGATLLQTATDHCKYAHHILELGVNPAMIGDGTHQQIRPQCRISSIQRALGPSVF